MVSCSAKLPLKRQTECVPVPVAKAGNTNHHPAANGSLIFLMFPSVSKRIIMLPRLKVHDFNGLGAIQYNKGERPLHTLPYPHLAMRKISKGVFFLS